MQKYIDFVDSSKNGKAVSGASIKVYNNSDGTTAATIYSDNGSTVISNSTVTADADGMYWFYAPVGRYDLQISVAGTVVKTITDVQIVDQAGSVALTSLASQAANTVVGNSTGSAAVPTATQVNNAMVSASAGIALSKLASQSAYSLVGNNTSGSAVPTAVLNDDLLVKADGSTTYRDLSAREADHIKVKDYGTDATGVQAAINAGTHIVFAAGTYNIGTTTVTVATGKTLVFERGASITYTGTTDAILCQESSPSLTTVSLINPAIDITGAGSSAIAIRMMRPTHCIIESPVLTGTTGQTGIKFDGTGNYGAENAIRNPKITGFTTPVYYTGAGGGQNITTSHIWGGILGTVAAGTGSAWKLNLAKTCYAFGTIFEPAGTGIEFISASDCGSIFGHFESCNTAGYNIDSGCVRIKLLGNQYYTCGANVDSSSGSDTLRFDVDGSYNAFKFPVPILMPNDSAAAPAYAYRNDTSSGLARTGIATVSLIGGGTSYLSVGYEGIILRKAVIHTATALSYSTSVSTNAALGNTFTITPTDGVGFTINNPTNPTSGQRIRYRIKNTTGGALGAATWGAAFKLGAAWTQPATGFSRSVDFEYDGTNWIEAFRGAADVAN